MKNFTNNPTFNREHFKMNMRGDWVVYCYTCSEQATASYLEKFYDKVGVYIGCGIICPKCTGRIYAIDRRKKPIVIKCGSGSQPMNYQDVMNYSQGRPTSNED